MGLSAPSAPPFLAQTSNVFCLALPGVAFFSMRTASAFTLAGQNFLRYVKLAAHEAAFNSA